MLNLDITPYFYDYTFDLNRNSTITINNNLKTSDIQFKMAEFLKTKGITSKIENIIRKANENVYLVSPYLKLSHSFLERLQDAEEKCVPVHIIYGKDELDRKEWQKIRSLKNIKLYFYKNLHAKCFANEHEMVITTMNMYEYSEHNNREMGISISKNNDIAIYNDAFEEIKSIIKSAEIEKDFQMNESPASTHSVQSAATLPYPLNHEEYNVQDFHLPLLAAYSSETIR